MTIRTSHKTNDEIEFLKKLGRGKFSDSHSVRTTSRRTLLQRYYEAALNRDDWGDIDHRRVLQYVRYELRAK